MLLETFRHGGIRLTLAWAIVAAMVIPLACGGEQSIEDRRSEEAVEQAGSPWVAHDLTHKINTANSGAAYIQECLAAGVPVPEWVLHPTDPRWVNHGEVSNEFLSPNLEAELWSYEDPNIDGVCAALPRWNENDEALLLGVICLGRATGNICFWDNKTGVPYPRGVPLDILLFAGGYELKANNQGVCSDCHAGENPFVVHPDYPAFQNFLATRVLKPKQWPRPIVHPDYPGNPGPIEALGPVPPGQVRCDSCHNAERGIRFPLVSAALKGYCAVVLSTATLSTKKTMPQGGGNGETHTNWLLNLCNFDPIVGTIVPIDGFEPEVLSPPIIGPVFACSNKVLVSGLVYGAQVDLSVDGVPISVPGTATGTEMVVDVTPSLGTALVAEQTVTVTQSRNGLQSDATEEVVQAAEELYPAGLPPPVITPAPLYASAKSLAVWSVPGGVELTVEKRHEGMLVATYVVETPADHTWITLFGEPAFVVGDAFTVKQGICGEAVSDPSEEVVVQTAPTSLAGLELVQGLTQGQQLADVQSIVQGARVWINSSSTTIIDEPSVAYNVWRVDLASALGSHVQTSHQLSFNQSLNMTSAPSTNIVVQPCNPSTLVAKIAPPVEGDAFVSVTEAIPGATIHVLSSEEHVGSGSGYVVPLNRELQGGETVWVIEELVECLGTNAFQIQVLDL